MTSEAILPAARKRRAGFTLIELLTVIAIIAILATILIPVVSSIRRHGNTAQAVSNLRQVGVGFSLFQSDNKGLLPVGGGWAVPADVTDYQLPAGHANYSWSQVILPYVADDGETRRRLVTRANAAPDAQAPGSWNDFPSSWAMNSKTHNGWGDRVNRRIPGTLKWDPANFSNMSKLVVLADAAWRGYYPVTFNNNKQLYDESEDVTQPGTIIDFRQSGDRATVLFGDWRVELVSREDVRRGADTLTDMLSPIPY